MKKMFASIFLSIMLIISSILPVVASGNEESVSLQEAIDNLENGYAEYYDILDTEIILCGSNEVDGNIEKTYLFSMKLVLKADSVEEMDYYQGAVEYCKATARSNEALRANDNRLRMNMLSAEQLDIYKELEEYIGKEQNFTFYIKETYPLNNELDKEILFENGMEYVPWEMMLPAEHEEIRENGYARVAKTDLQSAVIAERVALQKMSSSYSYSVSDAVSYMTRYTSNPSVCSVCGISCNSRANTAKYNSNYTNYAADHSDCANYVSQALCEGGIPTDSTWKAGSRTWINVSELTSYMTSNGYWSSVSYNVVQKGDVIKFSGISHVAMITSFDGTTYGYSAHTRDRLNCPITITNTAGKYYRVG